MTPATKTSPATSRTASTSTSMASSRKLSIRIGRLWRDAALARQRPVLAREVLHHALERRVVVDDLHRASAQHVARSHEDRVADLAHDGPGLGEAERDVARAADAVPATCRSPTTARGPRPRRSTATGVPSTSAGSIECDSLSGVCPPSETITPSTRAPSTQAACSAAMTSATSSGVSGSKYSRSDVE